MHHPAAVGFGEPGGEPDVSTGTASRKMIMGQTWVVVAISVIIALILFVTDIAFASFFRWIDVLQT